MTRHREEDSHSRVSSVPRHLNTLQIDSVGLRLPTPYAIKVPSLSVRQRLQLMSIAHIGRCQ